MTLGEFKTRYLRSKINPILFYLPVKKKSTGALKYKVVASEVTVTMDTTYTKYVIDEEQKRYNTIYNNNSEISCIINWGDSNYTTIYCKDKNGHYSENDGEWQNFSNVNNVSLGHSYTDGLYEHIVSISGVCSKLHLGKYPVEVIQWGNLKMKEIENFIVGRDNSFPHLVIPNSPMTGCEEITCVQRFFSDCSIQEIPNTLFKNLQNSLIYGNQILYKTDVKKLGDAMFKGFKKLSWINAIVSNNDLLEEIGNDFFMDCTGLDYYQLSGNSGIVTAFFENARLKKIGDNLFKNCSNLQSKGTYHMTQMFQRFFPEGHKSYLGKSTFENCIELKVIDGIFMNSMVQYFEDTFKGCKKIINMHAAFEEMGCPFRCKDGLFDDLENLKDISRCFSSTILDSIPKFPNSPITNIENCFYYNQYGYYGTYQPPKNTSLPILSGNNFYTYLTLGNFNFLTDENINDYIEIWHIKPLDCTGILTNKCNIEKASLAFYSYTGLYKNDETVEPPASSRLDYNGTWYGEMYPFWLDTTDCSSSLKGCQRITNFDSLTNEQFFKTTGYSKTGEYESWSNTAFVRFLGDRDITEWTDD